jgi:hypothetical protein
VIDQRKHLNSSTYRGRNTACSFCGAAWTSASGLFYHLESCPDAISMNNSAISEANMFTNKLLPWPVPDIPKITTDDAGDCRLPDTLRAVNQDLNSLEQGEKLFHCPNTSCNSEFVRFGSLSNRLESGSCKLVKFETVQRCILKFITEAITSSRENLS